MFNTESQNTSMDNRSLDEKLIETINLLTNASLDLRNAITGRKTNEIWDLLAQQEELAILLEEYFKLWAELHPITDSISKEEKQQRRDLRQRIIQLKATQKSNIALAHSFLSAIRKAMASTGRKIAPKKNVYNASGRMGKRSASVLIKSLG